MQCDLRWGDIMVSANSSWRVRIPAELEQWVTNRLVSAHIRSSRSFFQFLALNFIAIIAAAYGTMPIYQLAMFGGTMLLALVHRAHLADGMERRRQRRNPARMADIFAYNSGCLGILTGALLALSIPYATHFNQILLVVSGSIQIAAIAFTTRTLPRAAFAHMGQMTLGLVIGCLRLGGIEAVGVSILIIAASLLQTLMIVVSHKGFVQRLLKERELNESASTVRMLLNDFESQGSDWLFELTGDGFMTKVSERFATEAGVKPEDMNGRAFAKLFRGGRERKQLEDHLSGKRACRNLTLEVDMGKGTENRWWSVSLRPLGPNSDNRIRGVISDVSAEKHAETRVWRMAHFDSLTELPNRRMFVTAVKRVLDSDRDDTKRAILLIDFDQFKAINDMYGHPSGDAFLRHAAEKLATTVADSQLVGDAGIVARLGGDEFAVLINGADVVDQSTRLAQLLVETFETACTINGIEMGSGVSIGIALAPDHADQSDSLMSRADMALYAAKQNGRGRWEMFEADMDANAQLRHGIARDLRTAIGNGELRLFLQPLVNVESRLHVGFEALMRWEHPERGLVMPDTFIPIAEETGLIVPMGEWMIRTAMAEAASWNDPLSIAINLSPIQLKSPTLLPTIINALAETGIDPARVELEITESVLLHDCEANIGVLNKIHALGLKVALDDFGTGYASLNYLLTFPFDKIKIDRSFVSDIENKPEAQAIVAAVIGLANQLGMCTLAEGVEHEDQLSRLRIEGCEMVQGWLFGKAMPAQHYADLSACEVSAARAAA
jgi:diguanylate cyclase (GGDEF)-like protein